jgi:hypothetical protein
MLKLTIQLFIKALVIGAVVNVILLYAANMPIAADEGTNPPAKYQSLEQSSTGPANSFGQVGD